MSSKLKQGGKKLILKKLCSWFIELVSLFFKLNEQIHVLVFILYEISYLIFQIPFTKCDQGVRLQTSIQIRNIDIYIKF